MRRASKSMLAVLAAAAVLTPARAGAQVAGQAGTGSGGTAAQTGSQLQVYSNAELHLTYSYPAELTARDGTFAETAGRRMIYGEDSEDQGKTDACTKVLLSVGEGSEGSRGVWARVGLLQVSGQCFPPKVLRDKKETQLLLRNLVKQGTTIMGTMPLEEPTLYALEGHWAGFCAAQGEPLTMGDLQATDQQVIGVAAVAAEGAVMAWVIETNDPAMFNRLLGSGVDFGAGKPERLFPAEVR